MVLPGKFLSRLGRNGGWRMLLPFASGKHTPQEIFSRFQKVLAGNNHALEIIADLGEKGSGDYIFDQHYIRQAMQELHESVADSIAAVNALCFNRYAPLNDTLKRLTGEINEILDGREELQGVRVVSLDRITPGTWGQVGGKGAHLAELRQKGSARVPDGFVITTRSFCDLISSAGLEPIYNEFRTLLLQEAGQDEPGLEKLRSALETGILSARCPSALQMAITSALQVMEQTAETPYTLAVRSSAPEEDQEYSFAGQFHSELDVPPTPEAVFAAYRKVAASLFGGSAIHYHRLVLPGEDRLLIAACCQRMVRGVASGVAYSLDPSEPLTDRILIVGAWGLGAVVAEGQVPTDSFVVSKTGPPVILEQQLAEKPTGYYRLEEGGHGMAPLPVEQQKQSCLDETQVLELAAKIMELEDRARRPLDIEWSYGQDGLLYIVQARPLLLPAPVDVGRDQAGRIEGHEVLVSGRGKVAQQGIGCGRVFRVDSIRDLENFPDNGVLVSRRDSSRFVKVMSRAAAIITETGTSASHMATICREMQVPCLVGVEGVLDILTPGEEVTVDAEDLRIYRGRVQELLAYRATSGMHLAVSREFRLLRKVLKKVSFLNLIDPLLDNFSIAGCHSYHDILRFVHEKAVQELVELGKDEKGLLKGQLAHHLHLPVPVGVIVIDIGGGLAPEAAKGRVEFKSVVSEPFRAILQGMLFPDVWHLTTMPVGIRDLMNSMLSIPAVSLEGSYTGHNVAIIGANYVNLCFRLGYHFNIIDAYCSEQERDNHIYFRFLGGVSDMVKRSRRARMIEKILGEFDFQTRTRGDLVIARLANLSRVDMTRMLDILGRLVGFTRQLDVRLDSEAAVDYYAEAFLMGNYAVVSGGQNPRDIP